MKVEIYTAPDSLRLVLVIFGTTVGSSPHLLYSSTDLRHVFIYSEREKNIVTDNALLEQKI